jgi:cytochrome c biogenesis protein CcmG/thiol:disulfide interchange protein DsbE
VAIALGVVLTVAGITTWAVTDSEGEQAATAGARTCAARILGATEPGRAPVFRAPGLRGDCVDLSDYRGRPLVVNFWASYCNPCRKEFPLFRRALREHRHDGLMIVGVSHDDIAGDARAFASQFGATWPLALDPSGAIADAFVLRPPGLPHSYFVRRDGTISAQVFGETSTKELDAEIAKITRR